MDGIKARGWSFSGHINVPLGESMPDALVQHYGGLRADEQIAEEQRVADAAAMKLLAQTNVPQDLVELGERHGVPLLTDVVWANGFATGWRLAVAHMKREEEAKYGK